MEMYVDIHCHILPGVDDGARDLEESKKMLQMAYDEGIRLIIATPHYHAHRGHERPEVLRKKLELVRRESARISPNFRVYLGNEIHWGQDVPDKLNVGRVLTLNRRRMALVEFSPGDPYERIRQAVQQVQMTGNEVLIAHAERYQCLLEDIDLVEELYEMGAHIQINSGSIIGESGRSVKKFVAELMERDLVFGVGTDAHGVKSRPPKMKKAANHVRKKYGEEYTRRIFFDNPAGLLKKRKKNESV